MSIDRADKPPHSDRPAPGRRVAALMIALLFSAPAWLAADRARAQTEDAGAEETALEAGVVESDPAEETVGDGLARVVLATFTTEISDREPVDDVTFLGNDKRVIYFFTDLRNMQGQTIRHVWSYKGTEMGTVGFEVKGARWRAWSSKQLLPAWLGEWTVSVLSPEDEVLATESFTYQEAP